LAKDFIFVLEFTFKRKSRAHTKSLQGMKL
jgi:hypothetical protein